MQTTATQIVATLQNAGHTAYFVGGCVRDLLLGREPQDIDIATAARPAQIESLFARSFAIGKQFGVILIEENGHHFEVATFRSDAGYSDGRRPDAILFDSAEADAQRRDFTINGIFYDPLTDKYFDFVDGRRDLQRGLLRFIGNGSCVFAKITCEYCVRYASKIALRSATNTTRGQHLHSTPASLPPSPPSAWPPS